ncbi:MAG: hypothetical protein IPH45_02995 [Bacteroidales bacterium]|nr:hypothetical protein [Bacteroidales bacterium]
MTVESKGFDPLSAGTSFDFSHEDNVKIMMNIKDARASKCGSLTLPEDWLKVAEKLFLYSIFYMH